MSEVLVLVPFDKREAVTLRIAAQIAGKSETTLRSWCVTHGIGRRVVDGHWLVSWPALLMLLDDDRPTLQSYLRGDRASASVLRYFERCGLDALTRAWSKSAESANSSISAEMP
jgi:hypothetical protein